MALVANVLAWRSLGAMKAGRIDVVCHAFAIGNLAESQGIGKTIISPAAIGTA